MAKKKTPTSPKLKRPKPKASKKEVTKKLRREKHAVTDCPKESTGKRGNPNLKLPIEERKLCWAKTKASGICDRCKYVPQPDPETNRLERHRGKCPVEGCGGTMRCRNGTVFKNGRCRLHGGHSGRVHHALKHGLSNAKPGYVAFLPKSLAALAEHATKQQDRLSVMHELALLEAFLKDLLVRMKGGKLWDKVEKLFTLLVAAKNEIQDGEDSGMKLLEDTLNEMEKLILHGKNDVDLRNEALRMIEDKSRIAAREARRQLEQNLHLSVEESAALVASIGKIVLEEIETVPHQIGESVRAIPTIDSEPIVPSKIEEIGNEIMVVVKRRISNRVQAMLDVDRRKTIAERALIESHTPKAEES